MKSNDAPDAPTTWETSPTANYPVGPDDAGNAVMHGLGLLVNAWRWVKSKVSRRS